MKNFLYFDADSNIPFIYNYCDAWCDRCAFTARCAVFRQNADLMESDPNPVQLGLWQNNTIKLVAAKQWLKAKSKEYRHPLVASTEDERRIFDVEANDIRRELDSIAVIQLAKRYQEKVLKWLKTDDIKHVLKEIEQNSKENKILEEPLWVIQWYVHFIYVICHRAVQGLIDEEDDFEDDENPFPKDSDGSAKIAFISAENSLVAWHQLVTVMPDEESFIVKAMALLEAVMEEGDFEFPNARKFIRPGFDEINL